MPNKRNKNVLDNSTCIQLLQKITAPVSIAEDHKRRELILNILLLGSIALATFAAVSTMVDALKLGRNYSGMLPHISISILGIFVLLYYLSRKGRFRIAAIAFIFLYLLATTYTAYKWGTDIPQGILLYALIIVMSGILISTKFSIFVTLITSVIIGVLGFLQINNYINPALYWKNELFGTDDIVAFIATFGTILLVSWLSNREIEKSLERAHRSEHTLKKERDLLEFTVEHRTKQLKEAQLEKVKQLYRLADLGRITRGIIHDLANPLNVVSLNLEQLESTSTTKALERASKGVEALERYVKAAQRQIQKQNLDTYFFPADEIRYVLQIFSHRAKEQNIDLKFIEVHKAQVYGNPIKFNQLITNLIANAIDAYKNVTQKENRKVIVKLTKNKKAITITIQDFGQGIKKENLKTIFDPFFSTKKDGTGIGLTISKEIVEKEFGGKIEVKSIFKKETTFTVTLPTS